ncbi:hypothetical protein KIPE111705_22865 [Kibdelosporangium persicum]
MQAFVRACDERIARSDISVFDAGHRLRALGTVVYRFA